MKIVKKAAAIIVMILSAVLLLAMLAGVVGVWWGQDQVKGVVTDVSTTASNALGRVKGASEQVNTVVGLSQGRVDQMVTNITAAGTKVEETKLALVAAEQLLDTDLTPTIERVTERVSDLRDTIAMIDKTISLLSRLPGGGDNELLTVADSVIEKIKAADQAVQDFRTSVQDAKSQATAEAVNKLTTPLNRVSTGLGTLSSDLTTLGQRIDAEQAALAALTSRVFTAITLAAIVLTLAFLWMALAQVALFLHAYGLFTGRDPLARWHKGKDQGTAATRSAIHRRSCLSTVRHRSTQIRQQHAA